MWSRVLSNRIMAVHLAVLNNRGSNKKGLGTPAKYKWLQNSKDLLISNRIQHTHTPTPHPHTPHTHIPLTHTPLTDTPYTHMEISMGSLQQQHGVGDFSEASHWCDRADLMMAGNQRLLEAVPSCRARRSPTRYNGHSQQMRQKFKKCWKKRKKAHSL